MRKVTLFILFCTFISNVFSQVNLNNGLVAYYPFNGNANDQSGNNINGVINSATTTTDKYGQLNSAYYFNGSTAYIQLPYSNLYNFSPQDSFSISVDVLPDAGNAWPAQAIVVKSPSNPDFNASAWNYGTYVLNYKAMSGYAATHVVNGSTIFTTNPCWYNIIVTYKNGKWNLYVNGILEDQDLSQTKFILQDGPASKIALGKKGESFGDFFKGKMDEVRIYHRVLNNDEILALSSCNTVLTCNNWLHTPSDPSYVNIGDLDVSGNQITVEGIVNFSLNNNGWGNIVAKHANPSDANYILRPYSAQLTTSDGFFSVLSPCNNIPNKVYHFAFVYDGSWLKFYRNGYLLNKIPATGNLVQNNWPTFIGAYPPQNVNENFTGYMNEIRIWNVARTQAEIRQYMNSSLPSPTTQPGLLAYYTFENLLNKQGNATFNGVLVGAASINATVPQCNFIADSCITLLPPCSNHQDFSFQQNTCNPYAVSFSSNTTGSTGIEWSFGDGGTHSGSLNTNHTYNLPGTYNVQLIQNMGTCSDTLTKSINISTVPAPALISTINTTICPNASLQLQSQNALEYCWYPATGLSSTSVQNPVATPAQSTTYYLNALVTGNNLITNGNFSMGNSGFTSQYSYVSNNTTEGEYFVGNNPQAWNGALSNCTDHTGSNGNMLLVNGSPTPNLEVWKQSIAVTPNTNYIFTTWIQALNPANPAQLGFAINGNEVGNLITASLPTCTWSQFYTTWNSGSNTTAIISIINKNTLVQGNDFALDDIGFATSAIKQDSVIVTVNNPDITASNDTAICKNQAVPLNATGAQTYSWSPSTGLSNPSIANPIANPATSQQYIVTGINTYGCVAKDTVMVTVHNLPNVTTLADTAVCLKNTITLTTTGAATYSWSPTAGLSNPNISNPVFTATATGNYIFYVTGTDVNGCSKKDTIHIVAKPLPTVLSIADTSICQNDTLVLTTNGAATYSWSPATAVNNPNINNPLFTGTSSQQVYVTGMAANGCSAKDTINIIVKPLPLVQTLPDTGICHTQTIVLNTSGAATYSWSPATGLSNPNIANPTFNGTVGNYVYYVEGTGTNGCSARDTINITVSSSISVNSIADSSICPGTQIVLNSSGAATYSWSPATGLNNPNISNPTFTGNTAGTYVYYVTGTSIGNCIGKDTINITVKVAPVVKANADTVICQNQFLNLSASGAISYSWSPATGLSNPNIPNPVFNSTVGNHILYVTGTGANGCTHKDTVNIFVKAPLVFNQPPQKELCFNESVMLDGANGTSGVSYTWAASPYLSNPNIINPIATAPASQFFQLTITDLSCNKDSIFNVQVIVNPLPLVKASKSNDISCASLTANLMATGAAQYLWQPAATLSNSQAAITQASPKNNTWYVLTGTDEKGCINKDSILVAVVAININDYKLPNAFTPNDDGRNECFGIKSWGFTSITEFKFIVFNRFGNKVFETNDPAICWNGKINGQPADAGTYVYQVTGKTGCGYFSRKGNVILLR